MFQAEFFQVLPHETVSSEFLFHILFPSFGSYLSWFILLTNIGCNYINFMIQSVLVLTPIVVDIGRISGFSIDFYCPSSFESNFAKKSSYEQ